MNDPNLKHRNLTPAAVLTRIYGEELSKRNYSRTVTSLAFAGTVLGMITFGYLMDRIGRKTGMVSLTIFSLPSDGA